MKNKLFLTSMVAVMLAFPAYADLPYGHGIDSNGDGYIGSQTSTTNPAPINSADCDSDPLTYQGTTENYGTYTLTAQWDPNNYNVTYTPGSGCSGNGATDSNVSYGNSYTVKNYSAANITASTGYHLPSTVTWTGDYINGNANTPGTAGTASYGAASISYYIPDNLNLTVNCIPDEYTVTYTPGAGCTGAGSQENTSYGATYNIKTNTYVNITADTGYQLPDTITWTGNYTNGNANTPGTAGTASYSPNTNISYYIPGNLTLSFDCVAKQYDVTYAVGTCGGSNKTYSNALTYGQNYTVLGLSASGMTVTEPTGYTFTGWTESLPGGATRTEGDQYQPWNTDGGLTLTANCSANSYNVTYVCDNASASVSGVTPNIPSGKTNPDSVTYGNAYTFWVPADTCVVAGKTTTAWECVGNTSGTTINQTTNAASWATAENVTCTAQYDTDMVNLEFVYNNGNNNTYDTCNYGIGNFTVPQPTKPGYTFTGWKVTNWAGPSMVNN